MAYTRLLRACYRREKGIPVLDSYRLVRATTKSQKAAVDRVLGEFFSECTDGWHQKRADAEIESYQAQCNHNRIVGPLGGRPKKTQVVSKDAEINNHSGSFKEPGDNPNQEPLTKNQEPEASTQKEQRSKTSNAFALPDWIPPDTWAEFIEMRIKIKHPLTKGGMRLAVIELEKLREQGHEPKTVLETAVLHSWRGLFAPNRPQSRGVTSQNIAAGQEWLRREQEKDDAK